MHRAQPFQKPVNVVVVEDTGQRQLGGWIAVFHAANVARPMRAIKPKPSGAALCPQMTSFVSLAKAENVFPYTFRLVAPRFCCRP